MAETLRLKNTAPFSIGGKKPGEEWDEPCDGGTPLALFWRKRLKDADAIEIVKPKAAVAAASAKTKGD